jgi:hypothetical protein
MLPHPFVSLFGVHISRPLAYLDPGSGSYLLQLLVAAILGAALALRVYWSRIKRIFTRKRSQDPADKPDEQ